MIKSKKMKLIWDKHNVLPLNLKIQQHKLKMEETWFNKISFKKTGILADWPSNWSKNIICLPQTFDYIVARRFFKIQIRTKGELSTR